MRLLIPRMACSNPLWGAPRVQGELLKLGIDISERTVSRWLPKRKKPASQTWKTFLSNHIGELASIDFFTVPTATFRVLFVLIVLAHDGRKILHFNVTEHPTAAWTANQLVQVFYDRNSPRYLIRDRDRIYGRAFQEQLNALDIRQVVIARHSPWQSPYVERVIGTLRRECLDHVVVLGEVHLRRIIRGFLRYYHGTRTHLTLAKDAPDPRAVQPPERGRVVQFSEVGGLHHRYERPCPFGKRAGMIAGRAVILEKSDPKSHFGLDKSNQICYRRLDDCA